jgi:hypothetical protein
MHVIRGSGISALAELLRQPPAGPAGTRAPPSRGRS